MPEDRNREMTVIDQALCLSGDHPWQPVDQETAESEGAQQLTGDLTGWLGLNIVLRECKVCGIAQIATRDSE